MHDKLTQLSLFVFEFLNKENNAFVPGLGVFEQVLQTTLIDTIHGDISPPKHKLVFSTMHSHSNQKLVDKWKQFYNTNIVEAEMQLLILSEYIKDNCTQGKDLPFGELGKFHRNFNNEILFQPYETLSVPNDMFGLSAIKIKALVTDNEKEKQAIIQEQITDTNITPINTVNKKSNYWLYFMLWFILFILLVASGVCYFLFKNELWNFKR